MIYSKFTGLHWLSGVERKRRTIKNGTSIIYQESLRFSIDGDVYLVEGENYDCSSGGHMTNLNLDIDPIGDDDSFCPIQVFGTAHAECVGGVFHFFDAVNGKPILAFGNERFCGQNFVLDFTPENCFLNLRKPTEAGNMFYPGDWIIAEKKIAISLIPSALEAYSVRLSRADRAHIIVQYRGNKHHFWLSREHAYELCESGDADKSIGDICGAVFDEVTP